ncbi:MAG: PIN domain-containing protein [Methyloprofundus sp.]|nr:PIN domain-containing protein [Methyloprofundus sp.]
MNVVIDASVAIKWFAPDDGTEEDADKAILIFKAIQVTDIIPIQPTHWQAEVIAVLTRLCPETSQQSIQLLDILEFQVYDNLKIYQLASKIATQLSHHLFDTLYHAVALEQQALFITADIKYYRKAKELGNIILLSEYQFGY